MASPSLGSSFDAPISLPFEHERLLVETAYLLLQDNDADTIRRKVFEKLRGPAFRSWIESPIESDAERAIRLGLCRHLFERGDEPVGAGEFGWRVG
jgi:hypothetical protein